MDTLRTGHRDHDTSLLPTERRCPYDTRRRPAFEACCLECPSGVGLPLDGREERMDEEQLVILGWLEPEMGDWDGLHEEESRS